MPLRSLPLDPKGKKEGFWQAKKDGVIDPPSEEERTTVPRPLEAICLKALSPNPNERYPNTEALAEELRRFQAGRSIEAYREPLPVRCVRWCFRHYKVLVPLLLLTAVLGLLGHRIQQEHEKSRRDFISLVDLDFTTSTQRYQSYDRHLIEVMAPMDRGEQGVILHKGGWLWFDDIDGDHLEVKVRFVAPQIDRFSLILHAKKILGRDFWHEPPGTQINLDPGYTYIGRSPQVQIYNRGTTAYSRGFMTLGEEHELIVSASPNRVVVRLDGEVLADHQFLLPLNEELGNGIGFRSWQDDTRILSFEINRLSIPQVTSPIMIAEAFLRRGHLEDAIEELLFLAEDQPGTPLATQALSMAYSCALKLKDEERSASIGAKLMSLGNEEANGTLMELICSHLWQQGEHKASLEYLDRLLELEPYHSMPLRLVSLGTQYLTPENSLRLAQKIVDHNPGDRLDLSRLNLEELPDFGELQPKSILLNNNRLRDLKGLPLQNLRSLRINDNLIESLEGLEGAAKLRIFRANDNAIASLEPLRSLPIHTLEVINNHINSLAPLVGMPLKSLRARSNFIPSLEGLDSPQLQYLELHENRILEVGDLPYPKLKFFQISKNPLETLPASPAFPLKTSTLGRPGSKPWRGNAFLNCEASA